MYIEFITFFIVWYLIGCIIYNMKKKYFQRPTHLECISSCIFSKRSFIEISIYGNLFIILHASAIMIDFFWSLWFFFYPVLFDTVLIERVHLQGKCSKSLPMGSKWLRHILPKLIFSSHMHFFFKIKIHTLFFLRL